MEHLLPETFLNGQVRIKLVGVGGNGAQMASRLARMHLALQALGHPNGLHVHAYDPDAVSESNIGRQVYSPSDIGQNKAILTIHRLNAFYGLDWEATPSAFSVKGYGEGCDILVSCVDSASARREIHRQLCEQRMRVSYWLDLGNTDRTGQVVLGQPPSPGYRGYSEAERRRFEIAERSRLPCVTELFPELLDPSIPEDNAPSCSARMSLESQGLFTNDFTVCCAVDLLFEFFRNGKLRHHGAFINLPLRMMTPLEIDLAVWQSFGLRTARKPDSKRKSGGAQGKGRAVA